MMSGKQDPYIAKALLVRIGERVLPIFCYDVDWYKGEFYGIQIRPLNVNRDDIESKWIVYIGSDGLKSDSVAMPNKSFVFTENDIIRILGFIGYIKIEEARQKVKMITDINSLRDQKKEIVRRITNQKGLGSRKLRNELNKLNSKLDDRDKSTHPIKRNKMLYPCINPKPFSGGGFSSK